MLRKAHSHSPQAIESRTEHRHITLFWYPTKLSCEMKSLVNILPLLAFVWSFELPESAEHRSPTIPDYRAPSRQVRSPEPVKHVNRPGGPVLQLPPRIPSTLPVFPPNGGQWPKTPKGNRFRRSPRTPLWSRDENLFPKPSPTFPRPPKNPPRHARSPEPSPFVSRPNQGRPMISLPPGVNPTFPKNGGQWPEAYNGHRGRRSSQSIRRRDDALFPRPSPTFPNPPKYPTRYVRSPQPEPFVDRPNRGGSGSVLRLPPGVNPTFPKNGGQWPEAYNGHRGRRSPQLQFIRRDDLLFPTPSPTFPNPPEYPTRHVRSPEPEPFVDRPTRGGSVLRLPPGVNPTFPKNGGQWPDAYNNMNGPRYGRSILVPEPDVDRPNIARIVQKLPPVLSPTIPRNDVEAFRGL
ncbi:Hypothetical protein NTJ_06805 [Nesidiocoris tenuis]|uniref:Uncharacterized protein n=1 Tax=Nesidiocoris tenuis TaxID=355587 RepID=A0ABN7AP49_9HEMI|nr:Hypothetical protein NTJ_06805 [Nesidiocoris tenuis]